MAENKLGGKVRTLRLQQRITQVELAGRLGISASYLNLIEHNQRPLTAPLLVRLAQLFHLDLNTFSEDEEVRLASDLREVFGDPLFEEPSITTNDLREVAANPATARAILTLYRAYREARESTRELAARISDGGDLLGLDPSRLPSEEVSDVLQANLNHFPALEEAAERLTREARLDRDDIYKGLVRTLAQNHGIEVVIGTVESDRTAMRRYDPVLRRLTLSEVLPPRTRNFQIAHQIALLTLHAEVDEILQRSRLTAPESTQLCRVALANYFAGALLMPYADFHAAAESVRYDIELLGHRFRTSFEQVCHRLTTLQRPGSEGVPFHLMRVDIAGNISKRFSASGIRFARFSSSCPRWNVHTAFLTPGSIRTQLAQMSDGTLYFCLARTIRKSRAGYASPHTLLSIGLGCEVSHARRLIYSDGFDLRDTTSAVPVGVTCRLCDRMDCEQRAFPPIQHRLAIDENVRGVSFYAPA
jgi:predicted transcriptional regulator/transcriptional regulator with XRE-family HTH domain